MTRTALLTATLLVFALATSCSDDEKRTVVCWGDSLTAPHNSNVTIATIKELLFNHSLAYPEHMARDWADDYEIVNAGVGGENTLTIMARQGVYPMKVSKDVSFKTNADGKRYAIFPCKELKSSYDERNVYPLMQYGYDISSPAMINPCHIDGKEYELSISEDKKSYILKPSDDSDCHDVIRSGSIIETYASRHLRNCYAYIYFMGQNTGFKSVKELISQYKAMIDYGGSNRYVIIGYHKPNTSTPTIKRMIEMEDSMRSAFSNHYINLREYMVNRGISDAGLVATTEDTDSMSLGKVPPQLMEDGTHFTNDGYKLISNLIKDKFKELGY